MAEDPAEAGTRTYQIGEVAHELHLSLRTVRYWEEMGLVLPSTRTSGGFRVYSDADVERLRLVRQMKAADLSIEELKDLLRVVDTLRAAGTDSADRSGAAEALTAFLRRIRQRLEILRARIDETEGAAFELEELLEMPAANDAGPADAD